jgi:hypothetical protein
VTRRWLRLLGSARRLRQLVTGLQGIEAQLAVQNDLLARIADHLAPMPPAAISADQLASQTGVDHLSALELALVEDYVARTARDTGHTPTEEEVLEYLADEKTTDLHQRLAEREQRLADRGSRR